MIWKIGQNVELKSFLKEIRLLTCHGRCRRCLKHIWSSLPPVECMYMFLIFTLLVRLSRNIATSMFTAISSQSSLSTPSKITSTWGKIGSKKNFEPTTRFPSSVSPYTLFSPPWSVIVHISPSVSPLTANPLACFKRDHQKLFTLKSELLYVPCSISHSGLLQQYQCNSVPWKIILYHAIQGPGNQAKYPRINFLLRPTPLWFTFISKGKKRATEQLEPAPVNWWYI